MKLSISVVTAAAAAGCMSLSHLAVVVQASPVRPHQFVFANNSTVIQVCSDSVVRVAKLPPGSQTTLPVDERVSLIAQRDWEPVNPTVTSAGGFTTIATANILVQVNEATGDVKFLDAKDNSVVLQELEHSFEPVSDLGKSTFAVQQNWAIQDDEALYGGGEFQNGFLDFANVPVELIQFNTEAVVPFFVSSKGYGILWDNYARTHLNANQSVQTPINQPGANDAPTFIAGTPVGTKACVGGAPGQVWEYNASDLRFHLAQGPSRANDDLVLDCDHSTGLVHIWDKDIHFDLNQEWSVKNMSIVSNDGRCLKEFSPTNVTLAPCDPSDAAQLWKYTSQHELALQDGSGSCLTAASSSSSYNFTAEEGGRFGFYVQACTDFGCGMGKTMELSLSHAGNSSHLIEWDQLTNLPDSMAAAAVLVSGTEYTLSLTYLPTSPPNPSVYMTTPKLRMTSLESEIGDLIDYYFMFEGQGKIDGAIRGYRAVTGAAPLYARWVYGFWQCKEHYDTQEHLLEAAHGYRNRSLPVDNIVQDWHYWGDLGWGPQWDPKVYPNPAEMVTELKGLNMQLMVSVWSKFDTKTKFYKEMEANGQMLGDSIYYDAWNPVARTQFYEYSKQAMFDIGVACLWLDATEPEGFPNEGVQTYLGSGNALLNSFSLMTTKAISDGLREDFPEEQGARVFALTRSAFAGQQKNGAALWSGDISGKWDSLRRQVTASLNYQLSGIPYWSEDIGGFFRPSDQYTSPDYHNLLVRWFQFGSFTPIYRVHGGGSNTEIWNYGPDVETLINATTSLRYRLIPYIYSEFHRVEMEGYTVQRAMVFDFPNDVIARSLPDQFMFGSGLMVSPVVTNTSMRDIYLPNDMVNFWSGKVETKGWQRDLQVQIDQIPLHVPLGTILLLGPQMQWTGEKADPTEVRVFQGADGSFNLFEDDGASLDYRNGNSSSITFSYTDSTKTLVIGQRAGSYEGMLATRTFNIVFVSAGNGVGPLPTPAAGIDQVVKYVGNAVPVTAKH